MIYSVTGCNFGDEGKGLVTDYLSSLSPDTVVVRHNGGAQSGHTVETGAARFVFHELSSGSFRNADTFWAETFFPDIYKLEEEITDFYSVSGFTPVIYASPFANLTLITDILINMAAETARADKRHGSCGMGINEAFLRTESGFGVSVEKAAGMTSQQLFAQLKDIRSDYSLLRLEKLGLNGDNAGEYYDLLMNDTVLLNFSDAVMKNFKYITVCENTGKLLRSYRNVIFETGQGLRLDSENTAEYPNVTASRTGSANPSRILEKCSLKLDKAFYVSRSYLTRHGAGKLLYECEAERLGNISEDKTNRFNEWQGAIRYAYFSDPVKMIEPAVTDIKTFNPGQSALVITHLNETGGKLRFASGDLSVGDFACLDCVKNNFSLVFTSYTPFSSDIKELININNNN